MKVKLLTERELRACVDLDGASLAAVEEGFTALAKGRVTQPPIMRVDVPEHHGEVDVKSAFVSGFDSFAVKLSSGFFENHRLGLPSGSGLMVLLSAKTGVPEAVLLDNGYLTDVRTALAGAIAAKHLAVKKPTTVGIVGTGSQARYQLRALREVRVFEQVLIYGRDGTKAERYAAEVRETFGLHAEPAPLDRLCARSDIVITTTPARAPLIEAAHLHPGLHVTAMGSDAEDKQEIGADAIRAADLFVCDVLSQSRRLGELRSAEDVADRAVELGAVTSGAHPGRTSEDEVTICDLTGTGVQDTMIARMAHRRGVELGMGIDIDL